MRLYLLLSCIFFSYFSYAQPLNDGHHEFPVTEIDAEERAAGCAPANASTFLEFNNVKALIHSGGNLWQVSGQNFSQYEVPKGSGIMALFTSALWLGGIDINGQLKVAAVRYRQGNDYWTGPLTESGEAEIIPETCIEYDRHYRVTQDEVREFDAWFKAGLKDAEDGTSIQATDYPNYEIPASIIDWPAHGNTALGQNYYLAPFFDRDENGEYEPEKGDYPWYDIEGEIDCKTDRRVTLFGDETIWWVMNDKGNIHTETGSDPLGMEIRAQAFAFATNDEVNNMTFYNYELVNRSTQTLYETYFGVFIDGALGGPNDDYVGCDVSRGLGYTYNGNAYDATDGGYLGYGNNPPAAGVDFFEGPYLDNDDLDNPLTTDYDLAISQNGIPYEGLGIGYGDGITDNERLGMRRFLYYNNVGGGGIAAQTDPTSGQDYYNYLSGYWKDGTPMVYGGNGHQSDPESISTQPSNYMFPGDTDPLGWGTTGTAQANWTEQTAGNVPFDRRFAQSAGPFILKPGAVNNITTGIVWARATSGDPFQSVIALQKADDKAQALFDNCFKVLDGPHAPNLAIQEMENELIISIYNPSTSNNKDENFEEIDPFIVNVDNDSVFDNTYNFQGYQVFQLVDENVSPTELFDVSKARLVFQCDVRDSIDRLVNYTFDDEIGTQFPQVMVEGENEGIFHSFSVTEDQFATGDRRLVNFKEYHYMAIAYSANDFKTFIPDSPPELDGQKKPYFASRKAAIGEVISYAGIPHSPNPENGGTIHMVDYGYEIPLTKIDGWGNGGSWTDIDEATEERILKDGSTTEMGYVSGAGPFKVKVIDPLNLPNNDFELYFTADNPEDLTQAEWYIYNLTTKDTVWSDKTIDIVNEQLIPEWGVSVQLDQSYYTELSVGGIPRDQTVPIEARIFYADSSKQWLSGNQDSDGYDASNWIRSGTFEPMDETCLGTVPFNPCYYPDKEVDTEQRFEGLLEGTIAPFKLVGSEYIGMPIGYPDPSFDATSGLPSSWFNPKIAQNKAKMVEVHSIDVVITEDRSKWTRCPVIETGHRSNQAIGEAGIMTLRRSTSLDVHHNPVEGSTGMSWFPGYAIDIETGERLNMAFGENSWLQGSNGADMIWNPDDIYYSGVGGEPLLGGGHFVYVFGINIDDSGMPGYDEGEWLHNELQTEVTTNYIKAWKNCMWVMEPMLAFDKEFLSSDVRVQVRIDHPFQTRTYTGINNGLPAYRFTTNGIETRTNELEHATSALDQIRIVPNPYYAYSAYERNGIDNRVKITNLPERCEITIFNMKGQLVKKIAKDNPLTFADWTLKNHKGVPIASGVYFFHINVPGVGDKVLKWYAAMRLVDVNNL